VEPDSCDHFRQLVLTLQPPPGLRGGDDQFRQHPTADAPAAGDLARFGIYDRETLRVLVRDIEPQGDLSAKLTLIAEAPGVHTAEQGPIPPYDPVVTAPLSLPAPVVLGIASDARVMLVTPSRTLIDRVIFSLQPIAFDGATIHVLYRQQGTSSAWQTATVQEETASAVAIIGLQSGETYDFRLQYWHPNHFASPVTAINAYYVIGRVGPPEDLQNLSLAIIGGQALLRWDLAADLDVQFGGWIMFKPRRRWTGPCGRTRPRWRAPSPATRRRSGCR